jgi:hypothetical protein
MHACDDQFMQEGPSQGGVFVFASRSLPRVGASSRFIVKNETTVATFIATNQYRGEACPETDDR